MIRSITLALAFVFSCSFLVAQTEASDPAAKSILDKVRAKYEGYNTIETGFELDLHFPDQPVDTQEGSLARQGDKYKLIFGTQEVFSDGQALYMVMHNNKSVQINELPDPSEDVNFLSPQGIFNFYESDQFVYTLVDTRAEQGKAMHFIEFKPTDRNSEYSKLRMVVSRDAKEIVRVLAFAKDGSRYTFRFKNLQANKSLASNYFSFDKNKYPDYYVEDLR